MNKMLLFSSLFLTLPLVGCGANQNKSSLLVVTEDISKGTVTGEGTFTWGENVTVTATAKPTYTFGGWYVDGVKKSEDANYTFKMPEHNIACLAKFINASYELTTVSEDTSKGTIKGDAGQFAWGSRVVISATPASNYVFDGWYVNDVKVPEAEETYAFNMPSQNVTYTAKFTYAKRYLMDAFSNDEVKGTVEGGNYYRAGQTVTLSANAKEGYEFDGWYKGETQIYTEPNFEFVMPEENLHYEGRFLNKKYELTIYVSSDEGEAFGAGFYRWDSLANIQAAPKKGYKFSHWSIDDQTVFENPYNVKMPQKNLAIYAFFDHIE